MPAPVRTANGAVALFMLAAMTVAAGAQQAAGRPPLPPPPRQLRRLRAAAPAAPSPAAVAAADRILGDIGVKQSIALVVPGMMAELEAQRHQDPA